MSNDKLRRLREWALGPQRILYGGDTRTQDIVNAIDRLLAEPATPPPEPVAGDEVPALPALQPFPLGVADYARSDALMNMRSALFDLWMHAAKMGDWIANARRSLAGRGGER